MDGAHSPAAIPCGHEQVRKVGGHFVCAACGQPLTGFAPSPTPRSWLTLIDPVLMRRGALRLSLGAMIAAGLAWWGGFSWWILSTLITLVHECGHAVAAWCVGRPALPKFDLQYGGGITNWGERMTLLVVLWLVAWIWLARITWRDPWRWLVLAGALTQWFLMWSGQDLTLISYAGHGAELAFAAIFLVRAATGISVAHALEGWLYAIIGWSLWGLSFGFANGVLNDPAIRDRYLLGKGGVLDNDFVVLTGQMPWSLETLLHLHQALAILTVLIALGISAWILALRTCQR